MGVQVLVEDPGRAEIESVGVAPSRGLACGGPPRGIERPLMRWPLAVNYRLVPLVEPTMPWVVKTIRRCRVALRLTRVPQRLKA